MVNGTLFFQPHTCPCQTTKQQILFCKDCLLGFLFCESCNNFSLDHQGHQVLQVFNLGYRQLGIRIFTITDLFDVFDIETNNIENYFEIVNIGKMQDEYANRSKSGCKDMSHKCEVCGYELQSSTSKYCSIECKVGKETNLITTSYENSFMKRLHMEL